MNFFWLPLIIVFFVSCFDDKKPLKNYIDELPLEEEINASIYHYEKIVDQSKIDFEQGKYLFILSNYEKYLNVFFESEVKDQSELLYLVGRSIDFLIDDPLLTRFIGNKKQRKLDFGIKVEEGQGDRPSSKIAYDYSHFINTILDRNNYHYEKKSLREIFYLRLKKITDRETHNKNFEYLYYLITRYPDLFSSEKYEKIFNNYLFFNFNQLSSKNKKNYIRATNIIWVYQSGESSFHEETDQKLLKEQWFFSKSNRIVVRNRTHPISSRNLYKLGLWEPFRIVGSLVGEDGEGWYRIRYHHELSGFIEQTSSLLSIKPSEDREKFLFATAEFYQKKYLASIEKTSSLLFEASFFPEQLILFYHEILSAIAERSTSLKNPYTKFATRYPDFFKLDQDQLNLKVNDFLIQRLFDFNPKSPMLQYLY